jgi:hypothetical protein
MIWRDKQDVNILINMYHPSINGNFCDDRGNALKPEIVQDSNKRGLHWLRGQDDCQLFITTPDMEVDKKNYFFTP